MLQISKQNKIIYLLVAAVLIILTVQVFRKPTVEHHSQIPPIMDKAQVKHIVENYIMNNPEVILKSLDDMQKRKIQEMNDKVQSLIHGKREELENSLYSPFFGNDKGDVVIVEFFDYNCRYCQESNKILADFVDSDKNVKVIFKPLPILGETSEYTAKLALAIYNTRPDKFKGFHDDMMNSKNYSKATMIDLCEKHDLEYSVLEDEMEKSEIKDEIQRIRNLAVEIGISGAPAFIINGEHYAGLLSINKLRDIASSIRAKK